MTNPYSTPRPQIIDPETLGAGWHFDELFASHRLTEILQGNAEWLEHAESTSREIYTTLFNLVDPSLTRIKDGMAYINEVLWDQGYRPATGQSHRQNPRWTFPKTA